MSEYSTIFSPPSRDEKRPRLTAARGGPLNLCKISGFELLASAPFSGVAVRAFTKRVILKLSVRTGGVSVTDLLRFGDVDEDKVRSSAWKAQKHVFTTTCGVCGHGSHATLLSLQSQNVLLFAKSAAKSESKELCGSIVSQSLTDAAISARVRLCAWTSL